MSIPSEEETRMIEVWSEVTINLEPGHEKWEHGDVDGKTGLLVGIANSNIPWDAFVLVHGDAVPRTLNLHELNPIRRCQTRVATDRFEERGVKEPFIDGWKACMRHFGLG